MTKEAQEIEIALAEMEQAFADMHPNDRDRARAIHELCVDLALKVLVDINKANP